MCFRPSDNNPLVSSEEVLVIRVNVPQDVRIVSVRLPENTNVEDFTVSVRRPNGQNVPVDNGDVRSQSLLDLRLIILPPFLKPLKLCPIFLSQFALMFSFVAQMSTAQAILWFPLV